MPRRNIPRAASWPARALLSGLLIAALGAAQPTLLAWGAAPTGGHGVAPALGGAATIRWLAGIIDDNGRHPPPAPARPTATPRPQATPTPKPPPAAPPWTRLYVRAGDNLTAIAARTGASINSLVTVNALPNKNLLTVGQLLYVPPAGWTAPWPAGQGDTTPWPVSLPGLPAPSSNYTVRPGDSLSAIAARFGLTVDTLVTANRLPSANFIRSGQTLTIPGQAPAWTGTAPIPAAPIMSTYVVQPGDALSVIAMRFGTTADALATTNGLGNQNRIVSGQVLTIPAPAGAYASGPAIGGTAWNLAPAPTKYTVQPGDALSVIADRFGTTTSALLSANSLGSANYIYSGQVLTVPAPGISVPGQSVSYDSGRAVTSPPSIGPAAIDAVLASYHSPAGGLGLTFYALGIQYGIDPAYALAFFIHESSAGTLGVAPVTHSIGNIRSSAGYADYQGYRAYSSWEAGIADWYALIRGQYVDTWGLKTVAEIVPRYAPAVENDVPAYVSDVERLVAGWAGPFGALSPSVAGLRANLLPLAYRVTSQFGHYPNGDAHFGIDLDAPAGTAVTAPVGGVVVEVETGCVVGLPACGNGWGNHVWWRSAVTGRYLLVAHFTTLNPRLAPGVAIAAGTLLGFSGSTGFSTGPHVHVQASVNGPTNASAFDPSLELPWLACNHPNPNLGVTWGATNGCQ